MLGNQEEFRPKLTLFFEDDKAIDATLSADTKAFLNSRMSQKSRFPDHVEKAKQV